MKDLADRAGSTLMSSYLTRNVSAITAMLPDGARASFSATLTHVRMLSLSGRPIGRDHRSTARLRSSLLGVRTVAIVSARLLVVALAAGCGGSRTVVRTVTVERTNQVAASATGDQRVDGQIKSLVRRGGHYELRF
jgi:hypothetical protein